ncbi:MAG: cytochrome c biogenesis protein CcsA [Proteobacteria bacterium]|nr:cytochrome c biogenesis protein CcsA [Pseudomonadota bacterium]
MPSAIDTLSICATSLYLFFLIIEAFQLIKRKNTVLPGFFLLSAIILHLIALILRTWHVGHAPMANLYETLLFFSFCVAFATLIYIIRYGIKEIAFISIAVAIGLFILAILADHKVTPLYIALKTIWFEIHVMASFAGYALFTISFASAFFFLLSSGKEFAIQKKYEEITNSANVWGFSLFSFAMFSGAIWAYLAWGNYWFWEPKTIWSFILWFYFAGIVHGHYLKRWRGKPVAWMTIFGFIVVIFTYVGVGLLMKNSHAL